jgi:nucleotide-binding universal stress UspA family protein
MQEIFDEAICEITDEIPEKGRILVAVDDTECGNATVRTLEFLGRIGLRADVFLVFIKESELPELPPLLSEKKEMRYFTQMRLEASKVSEEYVKRLENSGFKVKQTKILFGKPSERILKLERSINPLLIFVGFKKRSLKERILLRDEYKRIVFETKAPVVVCKHGFIPPAVYGDEECATCYDIEDEE